MKRVFEVRAVFYSPGKAGSLSLAAAHVQGRAAHAYGVYERESDGMLYHVRDFATEYGNAPALNAAQAYKRKLEAQS